MAATASVSAAIYMLLEQIHIHRASGDRLCERAARVRANIIHAFHWVERRVINITIALSGACVILDRDFRYNSVNDPILWAK